MAKAEDLEIARFCFKMTIGLLVLGSVLVVSALASSYGAMVALISAAATCFAWCLHFFMAATKRGKSLENEHG